MKIELNESQVNDLIIAAADGERLYRRLRQDVKSGKITHYTEEECTRRMLEYRELHINLQHQYCTEAGDT